MEKSLAPAIAVAAPKSRFPLWLAVLLALFASIFIFTAVLDSLLTAAKPAAIAPPSTKALPK